MATEQAGEIFPGVSVSPEIASGTPVISGTRVPVEVVLGHLAAGDCQDTVKVEYDLSEEQIRAVFGYAARLIAWE